MPLRTLNAVTERMVRKPTKSEVKGCIPQIQEVTPCYIPVLRKTDTSKLFRIQSYVCII
jgi:hypothetical protein